MAIRAKPPFIRANILAAVVAELVRRQLPVEALLRTHIESDRIGSPYDEIPLARYVAFFEAAATLAAEPALGARVGLQMEPDEMGPLGVVFLAAPDVRTALSRLGFFLRAWQGGTAAELEMHATTAEWTYQIEDQSIRPRGQDAEFSLAVTCSLIRAMLGHNWSPLEIHFEHPAPPDVGRARTSLTRLLGSPILFDQSVNRLIIDRADLSRPVSPPRQTIAPYLEQHLRDLMCMEENECAFAARVTFLVARRMGHRPLNMASLASELNVSPRTFQRRLAEDGTTLRDIIRLERTRVAEALLQAKRTPIVSIAHDLGYADAAVFSRAFKAWRGDNPRQYRRSARAR